MRRLPLLLCSIGVFTFAGFLSGATITVTTTEPGISADGLCSFAEAVENVRDGDVHSDCVAGSDGLNIIELGQEETYLQRERDGYALIEEVVIINGNGSTFDAMDEQDGWGTILLGDAIINDLTISGSSNFEFGAIWMLSDQHRVSMNRCTIRDNQIGVSVFGGTVLTTDSSFISNEIGFAVGGDATLIAINSDFISNDRAIDFDDFYNSVFSATLIGCRVEDNREGLSASQVDIRHSTIKNNDEGVVAVSGSIRNSSVVGNGLGVRLGSDYNQDPPEFTVISSTISGNIEVGITADLSIYGGSWMGTAYIRDSTITGNTTGLEGESFQYEVKNSIISSNVENCAGYWAGSSPSRGFNLTDDYSCHLNNSTDMRVDDVMLSDLGDWGGSTPTHMLLEGSPAIDMVKWAGQCSSRDQRGYVRPADGDDNGTAHCDCGAVEYGAMPPPRPVDPREVYIDE